MKKPKNFDNIPSFLQDILVTTIEEEELTFLELLEDHIDEPIQNPKWVVASGETGLEIQSFQCYTSNKFHKLVTTALGVCIISEDR